MGSISERSYRTHLDTAFPHNKTNITDIVRRLARVLPHVRDIRRLGSPALDICWVVCGRLQGFYEGSLHPWDVAAAKLIAREAGAHIGYYGRHLTTFSDRREGCMPRFFQHLTRLTGICVFPSSANSS